MKKSKFLKEMIDAKIDWNMCAKIALQVFLTMNLVCVVIVAIVGGFLNTILTVPNFHIKLALASMLVIAAGSWLFVLRPEIKKDTDKYVPEDVSVMVVTVTMLMAIYLAFASIVNSLYIISLVI